MMPKIVSLRHWDDRLMTESSEHVPTTVPWHRGLMARRLGFGLLVAATWVAATLYLGNRGEAFWLLFPIVLQGVQLF